MTVHVHEPVLDVEGLEEGLYGRALLRVGGRVGPERTVGVEARTVPALDALVTPGGDAGDYDDVEL